MARANCLQSVGLSFFDIAFAGEFIVAVLFVNNKSLARL